MMRIPRVLRKPVDLASGLSGNRSQRVNRAASPQQLPERIRQVNGFDEVCEYHLTRIVRSHIVRLLAQVRLSHVDDEGKPAGNKAVDAVLASLDGNAVGALAADTRMQGNGVLLKARSGLGGEGRLLGLEYKSARGVSPIIRAVDGLRYELVGYRVRRAVTPPAFVSVTGAYTQRLTPYSQNVGFNLVTGNDAPPYFTPDDVVHVREGADDFYDGLLGDNLLSRCGDILDYDAKQVDSTVSVLERLFNPSAIVKVTPTDAQRQAAGAEDLTARLLEEQERLQRRAMEQHGGLIGTTYDTEITEFTGAAGRLTIDGLYNLPEFRYTAMFGVPAALAGVQAGMENSPWSNLATLRKYEYDQAVKPLAELIGEALTLNVLPDLNAKGRVVLDTTELPVLQEDLNTKVDRLLKLKAEGILDEAAVRRELGYERE